MQYLFDNQPIASNAYHVRLWYYSSNDRILIRAIQQNYKKPANWQFQQPTPIPEK